MIRLTREQEEMLLNPQPGTAAARAREYGIDLTLTIETLRLTPEQRIRRLNNWIASIRKLRANARRIDHE